MTQPKPQTEYPLQPQITLRDIKREIRAEPALNNEAQTIAIMVADMAYEAGRGAGWKAGWEFAKATLPHPNFGES